jgi:hypothetical protein
MRCCLSSPGSPEYILHIALSLSVTQVSGYTHRHILRIYLNAMIERVWRCTCRPRTSGLSDALGGADRLSLEKHLETVIERVWRCNWSLRLSELSDPLGGRDSASLDMHLESEIQCT